MNTKYKKYSLLAGSAVILASALTLNLTGNTIVDSLDSIDMSCVSTLSLPVLRGGAKFNGSVMVQLHKNRTGEIYFSGIVSEPSAEKEGTEKQFDVQRSITFEYQIVDTNTIKLYDSQLSKKTVDSVPDRLFNNAIYDSAESQKQMRVSRLHNGYLIGNMFSPSSLCVNKS